MKQKWFLSTLITILALLGYSRQQAYVPNQEIVMQFFDAEVTNDVAQNAIAIVKKQLQTIGVDNIQVRKSADGRLKITYNSDIDVASIKKIFSKEENLELGYTSLDSEEDEEQDKFPSNKSSISYNLNVCEIQNSYDAESDFNGYVLELTIENEHSYNPVVYLSINKIDASVKSRIEKIAYSIQRNIALAIDNSSHAIPEVRAGPVSNMNS